MLGFLHEAHATMTSLVHRIPALSFLLGHSDLEYKAEIKRCHLFARIKHLFLLKDLTRLIPCACIAVLPERTGVDNRMRRQNMSAKQAVSVEHSSSYLRLRPPDLRWA